jgi:hypothetical protein
VRACEEKRTSSESRPTSVNVLHGTSGRQMRCGDNANGSYVCEVRLASSRSSVAIAVLTSAATGPALLQSLHRSGAEVASQLGAPSGQSSTLLLQGTVQRYWFKASKWTQ